MELEQPNDGTHPDPLRLFEQLHAATKPAHRALERNLNLLQKPVTAARIERALKKFLGFHLAWETEFAHPGIFTQLMMNRGRARFAASDLEALGLSHEEIARVPLSEAAAALHRSAEITMGSLYVMEGSTLGGELIAKALRAEPWLPPQGLQYFSPPNRDARGDWNELKTWAEARFAPTTWDLIEQGAQETFTLMNTWHSTP
jgi:heme oxygenase (biliverdin-IX-beta and delta-forming)